MTNGCDFSIWIRWCLSKSGVVGCEKCRKGCQANEAIETLEHIILECPHYDTCRAKLRSECLKLNLDFTVINAMPSLHLLTEKIFVLLKNWCEIFPVKNISSPCFVTVFE